MTTDQSPAQPTTTAKSLLRRSAVVAAPDPNEVRRESRRAQAHFLLVLAAFTLAMMTVYFLPQWMPSIGSTLESWGILNG